MPARSARRDRPAAGRSAGAAVDGAGREHRRDGFRRPPAALSQPHRRRGRSLRAGGARRLPWRLQDPGREARPAGGAKPASWSSDGMPGAATPFRRCRRIRSFRPSSPTTKGSSSARSASGSIPTRACPPTTSTETRSTRCASRGRQICEFTRLAVDKNAASKPVLAGLFHTAYLYASVIRGCTHAVIEVNPRHVAFYGRALRFDPIGEERMNRRVNAPAVLLCAPFATAEGIAQSRASRGARRRALALRLRLSAGGRARRAGRLRELVAAS